jgi:ADP-ribosylglycohydrolase
MTHSNDIAIEATYLYCYAIGLLIKGVSSIDAFNKTKAEVKSVTIKHWFE